MTELYKQKLQRRLAQIAITNSALRNQGGPGIINKCREYCEKLSLDHFFDAIQSEIIYDIYLDTHTNEIQKVIWNNVHQLEAPYDDNYRGWGASRKALNLFFASVVYNQFFASLYNLPNDFESYKRTIQYLEVPLDSHVGIKLYEQYPAELSRWTRLKFLTPSLSKQYQDKATGKANQESIARVQLDIFYWRSEEA